jgi:hypothetical protein
MVDVPNRKLLVGLVATTVALSLSPTAATAAVHSGATTFAAPTNPPSLNPQPPADEQNQYLSSASVSYNDATGTVTVGETFWATSYWTPQWQSYDYPYGSDGAPLAYQPVQIGNVCPGSSTPSNELDLNTDEYTGDANGNQLSTPAYASNASLHGFEGQVSGTLSFDGTTWTAVVQSPYFAHQNWRCATIGQPGVPEGTISLNGYPKPPPPIPVIPVFLGAPYHGKGLQRKPFVITYTGDGTGFFAGYGRTSHRPKVGRLHWSQWTSKEAMATGADWNDNCNPDCATGLRRAYRVRLKLYRPASLGGYYVFTRMAVTYTHTRPPHEHKQSYILKLRYEGSSSGLFWSFS